MSLRDEILSLDDVVYESVKVPEWGNREFWLRAPTSADRDAFESSLITQRKVRKPNGKTRTINETSLANIRAKLVVRCVCEGQGNPALVFKPEDADKLAAKNSAAVDRLYAVAQRLAGITDEELDELVGN